jgi:hypothetical protein
MSHVEQDSMRPASTVVLVIHMMHVYSYHIHCHFSFITATDICYDLLLSQNMQCVHHMIVM